MDKARKKELARGYKETKRPQGVFAVRCAATGTVWTGSTRNLGTHQNQIWFMLRAGNHSNKALQAAWNAHGDAAFAYEIVEEVTDENPLMIESLLKDREVYWRAKLGAAPIAG